MKSGDLWGLASIYYSSSFTYDFAFAYFTDDVACFGALNRIAKKDDLLVNLIPQFCICFSVFISVALTEDKLFSQLHT